MKNIVLRVQSPEGTKRISVSSEDSTISIYEKVVEAFQLSGFSFALFKDRSRKEEIISSKSALVDSYNLNHGDQVFMVPIDGAQIFPESQPSTSGASSNNDSGPMDIPPSTSTFDGYRQKIDPQNIVEDEVDKILSNMDGRIQRERDPKLCQHNKNACCVHCTPLEPFDETYLREHNIKHLSFHTYLRKLSAGVDRGKYVALENLSCRIKPGCKGHPPWPRGICSKCQPSAVTLNRQAYRHVDNVMFENPAIVDRFLDYWRSTGHQRIGYLYGRYEFHSDVPLGIRATVAAIYEPPQESSGDRVKLLLPDEREKTIEDIASGLGLTRVGWIFTDLVTDDVSRGTVKYLRNIDTYFLSAQECIMAAHFQNSHPSPCRMSSSGTYGSKFVTVCVTGDESNQVQMVGYSVSQQCMALVRDNCLVPTKDLPQLGYIRESSPEQYVPDVFYKEKDSYGNEVSKLARPLPVEYLLVDVPVSSPLTPLYTFPPLPAGKNLFPVENRMVDRHIQDFNSLSAYMHQFSHDEFLTMVSDFHFLVYIATMEMLPLKEEMGSLLNAVKVGDALMAVEWAGRESWATVEQLVESCRDGVATTHHDTSSSAALWTCPHCTFHNPAALASCEMCSLPR